MITIDEAKKLARELSAASSLSHSQVLEAVAHASGFRDWNTHSALGKRGDTQGVDEPEVIPILRMFDHEIARDFYCDYLGFEWQWQHQFEPDLPVYAQIALGTRVLHLSENHGDATPGGAVMIIVRDLSTFRATLLEKKNRNSRPGIHDNDWGPTMLVTDPFGNRLTFWQRNA